jgi:hypothetical protein
MGCQIHAETVSHKGSAAPVRFHSASARKLAAANSHVPMKWTNVAMSNALTENRRFI